MIVSFPYLKFISISFSPVEQWPDSSWPGRTVYYLISSYLANLISIDFFICFDLIEPIAIP